MSLPLMHAARKDVAKDLIGRNGMLYAALTLVAAQYLGDLAADTLSLPVPGVVIGLLLLLSALGLRRWWNGPEHALPDALDRVSKALHQHFGLLFVPAGVGIIDNFGRLAAHVSVLCAVVLLSTSVTIAVTAFVAAGGIGVVPVSGGVTVE
jgi:holin-like protein